MKCAANSECNAVLTARTFFLWVHLVAIIVWIGGMFAVSFVAAPVLRREAGKGAVATLVHRFQRLSRELILVILLTGIFNLIIVGLMTGFRFSAEYLSIVGVKITLFIAIIANQLWYSYRLVPQAEASSRAAGWSALANALLAAVVVYLGLSLRSV